MRRWIVACLLTAMLAGCADDDDDGHDFDGGGPERDSWTLEAAPEWYRGEWWTYTISGDFGINTEVTVVVADETEDSYLLGMPADAFNDAGLLAHWPMIGELGKHNFTFRVHGFETDHAVFPLHEGVSWNTMWAFAAVDAVVTGVDGPLATIEYPGGLFPASAVFDAERRNFATFDIPGYGLIEMTDHGYGFDGNVIVPLDHDMTIFTGRGLLIGDAGDAPIADTPVGPVDPKPFEIHTATPRDHGSLVLITGNFALVEPETPGVYAAAAMAPDGELYEHVHQGVTGISTAVWHVENPGGDWNLAFTAAGGGVALVELLVYDQEEYTLYDGRLTPEEDD